MTSKLNIFNSLPQHGSDSEDEVNAKNAKNKVRHDKQDQRKHDTEKGHAKGHTAPRDPAQKEDVTRQKATTHKTKGVTAEPHPNDRQSGTGTQAYGGKPKKSGAGKGNWGSYKEDRKGAEEGAEEGESPVAVEEEKPEGITLSEYLSNQRGVTSQPQVNEAKSKITSEQLMKEVGKATVLKTKAQQEIDDKNVGKKKGKLNVNHHAGINSEHANLLGFRTGFVEKEYRDRAREDGVQPARRQFREKREDAQPEAQAEGEKTAEGAQATTEGTQPTETATTEATATATEGKTQEKEEGQKRREGGGYRGGRGAHRGGERGGDRPHGERRPYAGNKQNATKPNFEDESLFPKLG